MVVNINFINPLIPEVNFDNHCIIHRLNSNSKYLHFNLNFKLNYVMKISIEKNISFPL